MNTNKCTKIEQNLKDCIIALLQDYNGSWDNLKKRKKIQRSYKILQTKKGEKR